MCCPMSGMTSVDNVIVCICVRVHICVCVCVLVSVCVVNIVSCLHATSYYPSEDDIFAF